MSCQCGGLDIVWWPVSSCARKLSARSTSWGEDTLMGWRAGSRLPVKQTTEDVLAEAFGGPGVEKARPRSAGSPRSHWPGCVPLIRERRGHQAVLAGGHGANPPPALELLGSSRTTAVARFPTCPQCRRRSPVRCGDPTPSPARRRAAARPSRRRPRSRECPTKRTSGSVLWWRGERHPATPTAPGVARGVGQQPGPKLTRLRRVA